MLITAGISAFEPQIAQAGIVTNKNNTTESATKFFAIPIRFLILIDYHQKKLNTSLLMAEILCSKGFEASEVLRCFAKKLMQTFMLV